MLGAPGPWLPLLDRVTSIRPSVRGWDEESGTALADTRTATIQGSVVTPAELAGVTATATDVDPRFTVLPASTPPAILDLAAITIAESTDARSAVTALRNVVLAFGRDDTVSAGHSLGRLAFDVEAQTPMAAEQLVALHATLLRAVGIPSRIVVGYAVGEEDDVGTADLIAWTEVAFAGIGWVAFDPVPAEQFVLEDQAGDVTASTTTLPGQSVTQARVVPRELSPSERNPEDSERSGGSGVGGTQVGVTAGVLIVLLLALIVSSRLLRRRNRRRATSAPWSIAGAWGEFLDRLRENAAPAPPNRTVEEAVDQVEDMAPRATVQLRAFTNLVNTTLYSDAPPSWDDAEDAWQLLDEIEGHLRDSQGRSVMLKARLDPRSLRYPTPRPAPNRARRPHLPRQSRTDHPRVQR